MDGSVLEYEGAVVPLTPKAVDTLYLLVSRAPAVVTKEEIMKAVWPDTFVVESSLTRNISLIRKALEDLSGPGPYIETIPKRGYRFVSPVEADVEGSSPAAEPAHPVEDEAHSRRFRLTPAAAFLLGALVLAAAGGLWYQRPASAPPEPEATALIGWHLFHKVTPEEARRALTVFEAAVAAKPDSAIARAGLADTLLMLPRLGDIGISLARARMEAETAVRLDPRLGAAHASLGTARMVADWDFIGAEASLRRALELDRASISALVSYSQLLSTLGRFDEALAAARSAEKIDPVSPLIGTQAGVVLYWQRRFEDAARQFRSVLERERSFALAHYYLGLTYGFLGKFEEGRYHLDQAELNPAVLRTDRAWLALRAGDSGPMQEAYDWVLAETRAGRASRPALLLPAASLGRMDQAYDALAEGPDIREPGLLNLRADPRLEPLRDDPRYPETLRRLGLLPAR